MKGLFSGSGDGLDVLLYLCWHPVCSFVCITLLFARAMQCKIAAKEKITILLNLVNIYIYLHIKCCSRSSIHSSHLKCHFITIEISTNNSQISPVISPIYLGLYYPLVICNINQIKYDISFKNS